MVRGPSSLSGLNLPQIKQLGANLFKLSWRLSEATKQYAMTCRWKTKGQFGPFLEKQPTDYYFFVFCAFYVVSPNAKQNQAKTPT